MLKLEGRSRGCRLEAALANGSSAACVPGSAALPPNMIMTALRAGPAPGILAQIFINLSRSDVRRDGDLIRLRIIFLPEKSCPFVAGRPSVALLCWIYDWQCLLWMYYEARIFSLLTVIVLIMLHWMLSSAHRTTRVRSRGRRHLGCSEAFPPCRLPCTKLLTFLF